MKIQIYALTFILLMGYCSCSTDVKIANSSASPGKGHKVSLTIGSNAKTRAAAPTSLGGFDREKAIDGDKLYAVVFDQQGKFFETIKITDYNAGDGTCSFTLSDAGVYYGYIIANTSKGTALTGLTAGTSTEDDLFNIIEDTDPGTNLAASTNFLMTSKRTLLDVDGDADTALGTVTLTRAVARIDIDVTAVDGLAITEVKVENRYKKSLIIRGNNPDDTSLGTATPTDTKTYTRGTSAGQVDALSDGTGLVNDQQWQGVIYGYENINTNTVVTITHTLNGVASQTIVDFANANSGAGQAIKRNNIYTVKLTNEVLSPTLSNIVSTITVVDWDNSVNLAYTDLTDHAKPDYVVTSNHLASNYTDDTKKLNPGIIAIKRSDVLTEICLQITSLGKIASEVSFVNKNGTAFDFLGISGTSIEQMGEVTIVDGKIVQNYKITIPQSVVTELLGTDYFTFKVHNIFDDTPTGSREFIVKSGYIQPNYPIEFNGLHPLERFAEGNFWYNNSTGDSGFQSTSIRSCQNSGTEQNVFLSTDFQSGGKLLSTYEYGGGTGLTIGGIRWYLPTCQEHSWIAPFSLNAFSDATDYIEDLMPFAGTYKSDFKVNANGKEAWAIRFKDDAGNTYRSAYHYYFDAYNALIVEATYIGNDLTVTLDEISDADNQEYYFSEAISRVFPTAANDSYNNMGTDKAVYWSSGTGYAFSWKVAIDMTTTPASAKAQGLPTGAGYYCFARLFRRY